MQYRKKRLSNKTELDATLDVTECLVQVVLVYVGHHVTEERFQ